MKTLDPGSDFPELFSYISTLSKHVFQGENRFPLAKIILSTLTLSEHRNRMKSELQGTEQSWILRLVQRMYLEKIYEYRGLITRQPREYRGLITRQPREYRGLKGGRGSFTKKILHKDWNLKTEIKNQH